MIKPWHSADLAKGQCPVADNRHIKYWLRGSPTVERWGNPSQLNWSDQVLECVRVIAFEVVPPFGWTAGHPGPSDMLNPSIKSMRLMGPYGVVTTVELDKIRDCPASDQVIAWTVHEWHREPEPVVEAPEPPQPMTHRQHLTLALRDALDRLSRYENNDDSNYDLVSVLTEHGSKKV